MKMEEDHLMNLFENLFKFDFEFGELGFFTWNETHFEMKNVIFFMFSLCEDLFMTRFNLIVDYDIWQKRENYP